MADIWEDVAPPAAAPMANDGWEDVPMAAAPQSRAQVMRSGIAPGTSMVIDNPVGQGEAALRGSGQGALFGFADEIAAGATALSQAHDLSRLPDSYRRERSYQRGRDEEADKNWHKTYLGSELAGGAATAFIPGGAVADAGNVWRAVATGTKLGAAAGLGGSEADLTRGEYGKALVDTAVGATSGGVTGGALHGAGRLIGGAPTRAGEYAGEQLARAQAEGEQSLTRAARTYGPLTESSAPEIVGAIRDPAAGRAAANRTLVDRSVNELREGVPNAKKMRIFGQEGRNDPGIRRTLAEDTPLRQALESRDSDAALDLVRDRLRASGEIADRVFEAAQSSTPGVPPHRVIAGLQAAEAEFAGYTATKPLAKKVAREIESFRESYGELGNAIPLQQLRQDYRAWQDIAHQTRRAIGPLTDQQEVAETISNTMREALHAEVAQSGSPELLSILKIENEKMANYYRIQDALIEKSTREHADAPTGVQLFRSIREAVSAAGQQAARAGEAQVARGVARVQASPLGPTLGRGWDFAEQAGTVVSPRPHTRSNYGPNETESSPQMQALANAARTGANPDQLLQRAISIGIPEEDARAVINAARRR